MHFTGEVLFSCALTVHPVPAQAEGPLQHTAASSRLHIFLFLIQTLALLWYFVRMHTQEPQQQNTSWVKEASLPMRQIS